MSSLMVLLMTFFMENKNTAHSRSVYNLMKFEDGYTIQGIPENIQTSSINMRLINKDRTLQLLIFSYIGTIALSYTVIILCR